MAFIQRRHFVVEQLLSKQTRSFTYFKFSETFKDIPKNLQNFKLLHQGVDKIVGGIKCGLQTQWYKKG